MCSMSCNRAVRSRWSFLLVVLPFGVDPAHFWTAGSEAFVPSARLDLHKAGDTARQKMVNGSGGAASLLVGNWREPLRLTLDASTPKKASLPASLAVSFDLVSV
jgi:hypothetical protein